MRHFQPLSLFPLKQTEVNVLRPYHFKLGEAYERTCKFVPPSFIKRKPAVRTELQNILKRPQAKVLKLPPATDSNRTYLRTSAKECISLFLSYFRSPNKLRLPFRLHFRPLGHESHSNCRSKWSSINRRKNLIKKTVHLSAG
ncbi:MAG: hypothetical protein ACTS6G_02195 [Candidatus Hodgkinia cicadicola]